MKELKSSECQEFEQLKLLVYLIPIIGCFPSLWTLYHHRGTREQQAASRLSITLAFSWLLGYILLSASVGAYSSQYWTIRLLLLNTMFTSGYFLVSVGLMVRLWQRKSLRLPGISRVSETIVRKHLS